MATFVAVAIGFAALIHAFVTSDFSVLNVAANSHTQKPLIYKIAGAWGSHEGSMLLWCLILTGYGAAMAASRRLPFGLKASAVATQGLLGRALHRLHGVRLEPAVAAAAGAGAGRFAEPAAAGPGAGRPSAVPLRRLRRLLGGVLAVGRRRWSRAGSSRPGRAGSGPGRWRPGASSPSASRWAPTGPTTSSAGAAGGPGTRWRTPASCPGSLGDGAAALGGGDREARRAAGLDGVPGHRRLHALDDGRVPGALGRADLVHAFAIDPKRGLLLLGILGVAAGGALALYAWRAPTLRDEAAFTPVSREGALFLNNILLAGATAVVLIGTLLPLIRSAIDGDADLGRRALLQPHLHRACRAGADRAAGRAAAGLEARRPAGRAAAALACGADRRSPPRWRR